MTAERDILERGVCNPSKLKAFELMVSGRELVQPLHRDKAEDDRPLAEKAIEVRARPLFLRLCSRGLTHGVDSRALEWGERFSAAVQEL